MKEPTFTPAYVTMYPMLAEIARKHGYALAIHGTVVKDLDLIAVPWVDSPKKPNELMMAVAEYVKRNMRQLKGDGVPLARPEIKPHGRIAWAIPVGNGAYIDMSVISPNERFTEFCKPPGYTES